MFKPKKQIDTDFEKQEQEDCLLIIKDNKTVINYKPVILFYESYGVPPEIFVEWVNKLFANFPLQRIYHTVRAFDEARGTNNRLKLREEFNSAYDTR